ncbi:MAG: N-6 DNA methylase [Fusobacteriaceae bacterium]|jgi:adenine-specific DNA-methyltransferase|nr:N-6 DNA methylase [Fusobacteriaceae bacterium]
MMKEYNYSVYTPRHIAREIVKNTLDNYFGGKATIEKLNRIRMCDIACGSGNILVLALEELIRLSKKLTGQYSYSEHWISGYDINPEAVEIARAKCQEILRKYRLRERINIFCKDSLELRQKFNLIVGNPPYLGEKNNKEIFQRVRKTEFGKRYYEAKMDYLYFFIEKAVELLEKDGVFTYITTDYWMKADGARILRNTLRERGNFLIIHDFGTSLFKKAVGQHNVIFTWKKSVDADEEVDVKSLGESFKILNSSLYDNGGRVVLANDQVAEFNRKVMKRANYTLDQLVNINQGLVSGFDDAFILEEYKEEFKSFLKPFYKNKDIGKYRISGKNRYWILYLDGTKKMTAPIENHLRHYREKLATRREVAKGTIPWWQLQWPREEKIFKEPKIIARQRCRDNNFAYSEQEIYSSADVYFITRKEEKINLFYILGYLNSRLFAQWFRYNGKCKGDILEFYSTPLRETPVFYPRDKKEVDYIGELVQKQIHDFSPLREKIINDHFYEKFGVGSLPLEV